MKIHVIRYDGVNPPVESFEDSASTLNGYDTLVSDRDLQRLTDKLRAAGTPFRAVNWGWGWLVTTPRRPA